MMNDKKEKKQHRWYAYLTNTEIESRKRILSVMLVAVFLGSLLCLIPLMISGVKTIWINVLLAVVSMVAWFINVRYKNTDIAGAIIAFTTVGLFLPVMYFTQGGYHSGMPLWFISSAIAFFILTSEKIRYFVLALSIVADTGCLLIEKLNPKYVTILPTEEAVVLDIITSFLVCALVLVLIVLVFLSTEKAQREKLVKQKQELEEKQMQLEHALEFDSLTGIANRYSYNKCVEEIERNPLDEDVIVIAADVDGLKNANDIAGHDAGDALIIAAAAVLEQTFSAYGQVFRTGGDEFIAIIRTEKTTDMLDKELHSNISVLRRKEQSHLHISVGYADNKEIHADVLLNLQKIADKRMYDDKQEYYRNKAFDRRKNHASEGSSRIATNLSEFVPGGYFAYEAQGNEELLYINNELLHIFECLSKEQFMAHVNGSFRGIVHPEDLQRVEKEIANQIQNHMDLDYTEYRIVTVKGNIRKVRDYGRYVSRANGTGIFYVMISLV